MAHSHPHQRRPGVDERTLDEAHLHRGVPSDSVAGREEIDGMPLPGTRSARGAALEGRQPDLADPDPPGVGANQLRPFAVHHHRLAELDPLARTQNSGLDPKRRDRNRAQDLVGEPGDPHRHPIAGRHALDRTPDQSRGRTRVLGVGIPRPSSVLGRAERFAAQLEEGGGGVE